MIAGQKLDRKAWRSSFVLRGMELMPPAEDRRNAPAKQTSLCRRKGFLHARLGLANQELMRVRISSGTAHAQQQARSQTG